MLGASALVMGCGPTGPDGPECISGCPDGVCALGEWVPICPGAFLMGAEEDDLRGGDRESQHHVTLTRGFEILSTEVTQEQFEDAMGYDPSRFSASSDEPCGPSCPVENVSWYEAAAYCNVLSEDAGLAPCYLCTGEGEELRCSRDPSFPSEYDCEGFRLPTEAEWEYAARAGTTEATYNGGIGGFHLQECDPVTSLSQIAWYCGHNDGWTSSHPVAELLPNPWGLFDVLGNVNEWTADRYCGPVDGDCEPYTASLGTEPAVDPYSEPENEANITRGGAWGSHLERCRAPARIGVGSDLRDYSRGFRPARTRLDIGAEE